MVSAFFHTLYDEHGRPAAMISAIAFATSETWVPFSFSEYSMKVSSSLPYSFLACEGGGRWLRRGGEVVTLCQSSTEVRGVVRGLVLSSPPAGSLSTSSQ